MSADEQIPVVVRIRQLFQYLGIEQAHIAGAEGEIFAGVYPERWPLPFRISGLETAR